jgi:hypothetical protein
LQSRWGRADMAVRAEQSRAVQDVDPSTIIRPPSSGPRTTP